MFNRTMEESFLFHEGKGQLNTNLSVRLERK